MQVLFSSMDDQLNKIRFETDVVVKDNTYYFKDKSTEHTEIELTIHQNEVHLNRVGQTQMKLIFIENRKTMGYYKNEMGLDFSFYIDCKQLTISKEQIKIQYEMILDKQIKSLHKILLIFH